MKSRFLLLIKYFLFWMLIFVTQKIIFLAYNFKEASEYSIYDFFLVIFNGMKMDASMTAYFLIIPSSLIFFGFFLKDSITNKILKVYTISLLIIVTYLGIVDMELYSYWGFKLDITPLLYIKTPGEALASVDIGEILLLFAIFFLVTFVFVRLNKLIFHNPGRIDSTRWFVSLPSGFLSLIILAVLARGGLGISTMNLSKVYFHKERFLNHSAINVTWNAIYSFIEKEKLHKNFRFMDEDKAQNIIRDHFINFPGENQIKIKPESNVLIIILESFSNKIISSLGGENGITPCTNALCNRSIVFDNFFSNGDRSDKGLISIFSGFPAQPVTSIIDYPSKSQKLPFLYEPFYASGYHTAFYYGGDLNFANFKSYFSNPSIEKLITKSDFPYKAQEQKWGVPDGLLLERMKDDLDSTGKPFFFACFTLSSHEPFDVPMKPVFGTGNRDELSKNGFYYTDSVLNKFLMDASETDWWENTLVIITADHGSRSPGNTPNHSEEKFRIPMIWTGGAILSDTTKIHTVGSQTDIPATLLSLFGYGHDDYVYSRNLLNPGISDFAFYAFNNGFGCVTPSGYVVYDNDYNQCIVEKGTDPGSVLTTGKAFLQVLSADFLEK